MIFQWKKEEAITETLAKVSTLLTLIFLTEVIMKNIAFTPRGYWQSRRNRYDLLVTVVGVIWISLFYALKVFCTLTLVQLLKYKLLTFNEI